MDGALELGPRALGHRSILAAPHAAEMRDRLNRDIKYREEFRPFAPVVPVEAADRYFELPPGGDAPGALHVGRLPGAAGVAARLGGGHPRRRHGAGAGARARHGAAALRPCSRRTGSRTGVPVLLNTSFNLAGEPIVNRVVEGYSTFRRCGIDVLVAGQTRVVKRASPLANPKEQVA